MNWGPLDRVLIHLLPAGVEKCGPHLELPIALASMGVLQDSLPESSKRLLSEYYFVGALDLSGRILPTLESEAWEKFSPANVIGPSRYESLEELWFDVLAGEFKAAPVSPDAGKLENEDQPFWNPLKRHSEQYWIWICYLAGLPVLLLGPPGVGKSYLAKWSEQLLFFSNVSDESTVKRLWSLAGLDMPLKPPVLTPLPRAHFSEFTGIQRQGILRPGYFALSHKGMMVLDEFCEFSRDCREILRNILDEKRLLQNTKSGQVLWPADFFLILTSNPCPCGMSSPGDLSRCRCPPNTLQKYQARISGPLFDRMGVRLFLKEEAEAPPLPPALMRVPQTLKEVKEAVDLVEKHFDAHFSSCVDATRNFEGFKNLSQRELVNKARLLCVLHILTEVSLKNLIPVLKKKSQQEKILLDQNSQRGMPCSPFGTVSHAQT